MVFCSRQGYTEMLHHIEVHKYFLNEDKEGEIPFVEAADSWYEHIYRPIIEVVRSENMLFSVFLNEPKVTSICGFLPTERISKMLPGRRYLPEPWRRISHNGLEPRCMRGSWLFLKGSSLKSSD